MGKSTEATETKKPAGKNCTRCKEWKGESEFSKDRSRKDGLRNWCRDCDKAQYKKNQKKILARKANYHNENKEIRCDYQRNYQRKNRGKLNCYLAKYRKGRRTADVQYSIKCALRARGFQAFRNNYRAGSAVRDLGMTIPEFRAYIESLWLPGMTWDNWGKGGWNLDHIFPLAKADLTDRAQFLAVANWQNYQPLWEADNFSKNDKVTPAARRLFNRLCRQFAEEEAAA